MGISHNLGSSKVKLPHAAVVKPIPPPPTSPKIDSQPVIKEETTTNHETNLIVLTFSIAIIAWMVFR